MWDIPARTRASITQSIAKAATASAAESVAVAKSPVTSREAREKGGGPNYRTEMAAKLARDAATATQFAEAAVALAVEANSQLSLDQGGEPCDDRLALLQAQCSAASKSAVDLVARAARAAEAAAQTRASPVSISDASSDAGGGDPAEATGDRSPLDVEVRPPNAPHIAPPLGGDETLVRELLSDAASIVELRLGVRAARVVWSAADEAEGFLDEMAQAFEKTEQPGGLVERESFTTAILDGCSILRRCEAGIATASTPLKSALVAAQGALDAVSETRANLWRAMSEAEEALEPVHHEAQCVYEDVYSAIDDAGGAPDSTGTEGIWDNIGVGCMAVEEAIWPAGEP